MKESRRKLLPQSFRFWSVAVAVLMVLLPVPLFAQIQVSENTTKRPLDGETAADLYHTVMHQMESRGWRLVNRPTVEVHVLEKKEIEKALLRCLEQSCAHILRLGDAKAKDQPLVFLTIASSGVDVWMDNPHTALLARAVAVGLDYENRLYLGPEQIREVADMTASLVRVRREGKIHINALRAQR